MPCYERLVSIFVSFDDLITLADFGPVVQVAAVTFVQHLGGLSESRGQLLGTFESFVLALVHDVGFAAIQAAVDEFAAGFQNFLRSVHVFGGSSITLGEEFAQLGGLRGALGLASFRLLLVQVDQAANAGLEVSIATQLEESQELLDTFAFRRFRACIDARFGFSGDSAELGPGLSIADCGRNASGASDIVLDECADFGAAFRCGHLFR